MPLIPNSFRARLVALLEKAGLKQPHATGETPTFRRDLQRLVDAIVSGEGRPEIRSAIRKGVSAEQWSALLRAMLDALHPYDAITVLSQAKVTRPLEGIDEKLLIHTGTRSANMRIQAASKEPWTYQWVRAAIRPGEVLYDIGANVGGYSLIALARGATVVAFEPHHENFRELCRNIGLNQLEANATLVPVALSDQRGALRNPTFSGAAGQSMTLEEAGSGPVSIIADRLDDLRQDYQLPAPNHIKIDVDGFELKVLKGAQETFASEQLRTCLIEIDIRASEDEDRLRSVCRFFADHGFVTLEVTKPMAEIVHYLLVVREPSAALRAALEQSGIGLKSIG
jgi:FkbM family methyltransferase